MSDETENKVVSLADFKQVKELEEGLAAHEDGGAFMFEVFEFDDGELPNGIGFTECETHPICVLLDKEELTGITMSLETAERLSRELAEAIETYKRENSPKEGA